MPFKRSDVRPPPVTCCDPGVTISSMTRGVGARNHSVAERRSGKAGCEEVTSIATGRKRASDYEDEAAQELVRLDPW